jgi:hypothetical protein
MAARYTDWIEQGSTSGQTTYESPLTHLLQAETTDRALHSIRYPARRRLSLCLCGKSREVDFKASFELALSCRRLHPH